MVVAQGAIYPALAVADEIKSRAPKAKIILIGSRRGLEKKVFSKSPYKAYYLPVGQLHSSVGRLKQLKSLILLPICILISFYLILRYRPKSVLGVGGYASGPLCIATSLVGIKTFIWEGNATPGITNRVLGRFNTRPFLVFKQAEVFFKRNKAQITGVPIRKEIETALTDKNQENNEQEFSVLFVGGSQGAKVFNEVLPRLFAAHHDKLSEIKFVHQTGLKNFENVKKDYGKEYANLEVVPYLDPIYEYYQNADLIVCRAGAGTVNEIALMGKACILVPFPKASDDHQKKNAQSMADAGAAILIEEKYLNVDVLFEKIINLKQDKNLRNKLAEAAKKTFPKGARDLIATKMME